MTGYILNLVNVIYLIGRLSELPLPPKYIALPLIFTIMNHYFDMV